MSEAMLDTDHSHSEARITAAPSILDKLRAPVQSELHRKHKTF